jgi:hypothetical protein
VYNDGVVSTIKNSSLPCLELDTSKSGLSTAVGGFIGVVTASNSASIKLFPVAELRRLAEEARMEVQAATAERAQWPVFCFTPARLTAFLEEKLLEAQQGSMDYDGSLDEEGGRRPSRSDRSEVGGARGVRVRWIAEGWLAVGWPPMGWLPGGWLPLG